MFCTYDLYVRASVAYVCASVAYVWDTVLMLCSGSLLECVDDDDDELEYVVYVDYDKLWFRVPGRI